jgi:hypothetical protein
MGSWEIRMGISFNLGICSFPVGVIARTAFEGETHIDQSLRKAVPVWHLN